MIGFGQGRDRAERLLTLACVLQMGRPMSLAELRDRFGLYRDGSLETSRRQFERDKQDLRALGIGVTTHTVAGEDAYAIRTQVPAVAIDWTDDELLALATLTAAVGDQVSGAALAKVTHHHDVMPDERAAARIRIELDVPEALTNARAEGRRVRFTYRDAKGEVTERHVEPWAIASRRGQTYVTGHDLDRGAGRAFRVDRIVGDVHDDGEATHPRPERGLGVPLAPEDRTDVRVRIPAHRLADAIAMGGTVVTGSEDGSDAVEADLPQVRTEAAIGWSLRHRAEVRSPATIADAVADRRARLVAVHAGDPSQPPLDASHPARRRRRAGLSEERLTRLLALPEWLAARPGITVPEIATAFGADEAEVVAELELLEWLEVPHLGFVGDLTVHADGQVEFVPLVNAPRAELTTVEAVHLLSLVEVARALLPADDDAGLAAVAARLREHLGDAATTIAHAGLDSPALAVLRDTVGGDATVTFTYRGRHDDEAGPRRVRPLQLQLLDGSLYLSAFDLERRDVRTFRLDRLHDVAVAESADAPADPAEVEPTYVAVGDEVAVELRLTTQATWILRLLAPTRTVALDDGDVHALVHTDAPDWLVAHVRAAGGQAELLRPDDLRRTVRRTASPALTAGG